MNLKSENLAEIRRDFHKFPELGFQEKRTKDKMNLGTGDYLMNFGGGDMMNLSTGELIMSFD